MMTLPAIGPADWFATEAKARNASARASLKKAWHSVLAALFWLAVMVHVGSWVQWAAFALAVVCCYRVLMFAHTAWLDRTAARIAAGFVPIPENSGCANCNTRYRISDS